MKKIFALFLLSPVLAFAHPGHLSEGWLDCSIRSVAGIICWP